MILLTGYEPFGEFEINPSGEMARRLDGQTVAGQTVAGEVLPVAFDRTADRMADLIDERDPDAVVATGLAGGRSAVAVERVGINVDDAVGTPDNDGADPEDVQIHADGPAARFATLPVGAVVERCLDRGIPARLSNSAGTHLCNHLLYATREHVERAGLAVPVGFVHLPLHPEEAIRQADEPARGGGVAASMPLELQADAVETAIEVTAGRL
ncbi:MAG: pyroglutamyl-peptidase I [Halobacteriales archaeon]